MTIRNLAASLLLLCTASLSQAQDEKTFFLISDTHLDTQWNWDVKTTISQYVKNTLVDNMALMDKYPDFRLNYEGAIKYMWMKEYYPQDFERLKQYVQSGQWHVSGMSVDASDVMMSSAESILHSMLYANRFYKKEFGVRGGYDVMLPDCFGFSYVLPSLMRHAGQRGFHTAKLGWGAAAYDQLPHFGVWQGVDGSQVYAIYKPGAYDVHEDWNKDLTSDSEIMGKINANITESGVPAAVKYVGPRGDRGGALQDNPDKEGENTPYWLSYNVQKQDGDIRVRLASPDEFFQYMADHDNGQYKVWNSELPMRTHGVGSYTSWGALKLWNRKNELLADAAEKASSLAMWLGARKYPEQLRDAWIRTLWQQHHDGITGTSILSANDYSYNEYYLANRTFAQELSTSAGATIQMMDTQTEGTPIVVYNPLSHERTDIVEGSVFTGGVQNSVRVLDPDGNEVLSQVTGFDFVTHRLHFIFAATVPSLGYAVYEARIGEKSTLTSELSYSTISGKRFSNGRYRVTVNANGDISSLYDLKNNRAIINSAVRQQLIYDHEDTWPAWEISYTDVCRTPSSYVSKDAEIELVEDGPLRKSLKVKRQQEGSTFVQYIRMNAVNDRIECVNEVDWQTYERMLKVCFTFPTGLKNSRATYDISLGTISRGVRSSDEYEVCGHQWADQSNNSGTYGLSILSDCKYGWDKPNDTSLRLTLLRTPSCKSYDHQANMDLGPNKFTYALLPHEGTWGEYTQMQAGQLNQPLLAFVASKHTGALGRRVAFASLSSDKVAIKALKKAEDTDELIVRVYEWAGEDQQDVRLSFPVPIVSAREVNGIEETIDGGDLTTSDGTILFSIGRYQPKTFAIRLEQPEGSSSTTEEPRLGAVSLTYNIDLMSYDVARDAASNSYTYAYPAELIPDTLVADGIGFVMGPREGTQKNVLRLNLTQTLNLERQPDENKLYLLLASPTEAGAKVTVTAGSEKTVLDVPYFTGRAAEPPSCIGLAENYRKQNIVFTSSHAHKVTDKTNQTMQMLYIYKYGIELPEGIDKVTVNASDRKTFLFAATVAASHADDVEAFAPLTTEVETSFGGKWNTGFADNRLETKTVSASHYNGNNEAPRFANDQNPTTKWCVTKSQSETPWLQYNLKDTAVVTRWMVLGAARESGGYVAKAFKLQYQADDETWVDADIVEGNQMNKVVRTLQPVTTTRVRLQMIQGEQDDYTTRIYEFAVYGYLKKDDPTGIGTVLEPDDAADAGTPQGGWFTLSGQRVADTRQPGIYVRQGKKISVSR
ncbi:MAG: discoidin domain-containing protein [Bacteroidaceae bacterium]|nr:discoidin domain-containing protein [Bacteroidaceae bacterium]